MLKWEKKGDFSLIPNAGYYNRTITYRNTNNKNWLNLFSLTANNAFCIQYHNPDSDFFGELKKNQPQFIVSFSIVGTQGSSDKEELKTLLDIIDSHDSLAEIKDEIFGYLGIEIKKSEKEVWIEIEKTLDNRKFTEAFNKAKDALANGYDNIISTLSEKLKSINDSLTPDEIDQILSFYYDLTEKNKYYKNANQFIHGLLAAFHEPLNEEKRIELLELKFRFALRCGEQFQEDCGVIFHALCDEVGPVPEDKKLVTGNADFLIAVAKQIRVLKQEIKQLKPSATNAEVPKVGELKASFWSVQKGVEPIVQPEQTASLSTSMILHNGF